MRQGRFGRAGARRWGIGISLLLGAGLLGASDGRLSTPQEVEDAFFELSPMQQMQLAEQLSGLFGRVRFASAIDGFLPAPKSALDGLPGGSDNLGLNLASSSIALPAEVLALLPSALRYRWETSLNGYRQRVEAVLNLPTLLDVDGDSTPDVNAMLSISGTNSVTMTVERIGGGIVKLGDLPLKIEAVVADPRAGSTSLFALGYDASDSRAPDRFSEVISIGGGVNSTELTVSISATGAGPNLTLLAEEFAELPNGQRDPDQTVALGLAPVPASAFVTVSLGDDISLSLGATPRSTADVRFVDHAGSVPQTVLATIDQLPTEMNLQFVESNGDRLLSYTASQTVGTITVDADELSGFGDANRVALVLGDIPTAMSLSFGSEGEFDLDLGNADLGLLEALLTDGATVSVPAGYDGVTLLDLPGSSVLSARIRGLKRVSGQQAPLSLYLDSIAAQPFRVELREQPGSSAKQTYTLATLRNLQRRTRIAVKDGSKQEISYSADAAASSFSFETNAGSRDRLTASASPLASQVDICAAGNNACSTSGKAGNTGSFRVTTSQHMTLNLRDCSNASCAEELRLTNFNIRHVDMAINVGRNCPWYGCWPQGSKGSIWLDTDNHSLTGRVLSRSSSFTVNGNFGSGFRTNNRYVSWSYFVPSKSGSISCGSGTYLDVTVFGITIDISGLYLC